MTARTRRRTISFDASVLAEAERLTAAGLTLDMRRLLGPRVTILPV